MKRIFMIALATAAGVATAVALQNDSVPQRTLQEVTVNAELTSMKPNEVRIIPTGNQKSSAQNGIDLLRRMAIPQIRVSLVDDKVTTLTGEPVKIFVNYIQVSDQELQGIRTADVKRVEYLYSPSDPRFMGEQNVINIIVKGYEYGGYTKLSANEKILGVVSGVESVYSKFGYKKMTYDLYAGYNNEFSNHNGVSLIEEYRLEQPDGEVRNLKREQLVDKSLLTLYSIPVTLRAAYSGKDFQTTNTIGFYWWKNPHDDTDGKLIYAPSSGSDYDYQSRIDKTTRMFSYNGTFNMMLPGAVSLFINPHAAYARQNQFSSYSASLLESSIINNVREDITELSFNAMARKIIGGKHYLTANLFGGYTRHKVLYEGESPAIDKISDKRIGGSLRYAFNSSAFNANFQFGVRGERNTTNNINDDWFFPFISAGLGWSPNQKNSINTYFLWSSEPIEASMKSPNILRENELMYYTGNPFMKRYRNVMFGLTYNRTVSGWLQITPFTQFYSCFNRVIPVYEPYKEGTAVLRRYVNDGDHFRTIVGVSVTAYFLERNLQIQLQPQQVFYKSTGYYDMTCSPWLLSGSISYYLRNWYFSGYYERGNKALWTNSGTVFKDKWQMRVSAGWKHDAWNIRAELSNPFRSSWLYATTENHTPVYSQTSYRYNGKARRNLELSVTYTIGYGKSISRDNEVGAQNGGSSAILK